MDKIFPAPKILVVKPVESVGFYDYLGLKECVLKPLTSEITYSCERLPEFPTRNAMIGRFHHKVFEFAASLQDKAELKNKIEDLILNLQKEVDQWAHLKKLGSVSGWDEVNDSAKSAIKFFKDRSASLEGNSNQFVEKSLLSKDGILKGRPDYFVINGNKALVREYKSSSLRDEKGAIRQEYSLQGFFYSVLLFDNFEIESVDVSLESLNSDRFLFSVTKKEAEEFRKNVISAVKSANSLIESSDFTDLETPSLESCQYCKNKIVCSKIDKAQFAMPLKGPSYKIHGIVLNGKQINPGTSVIQVRLFFEEKTVETTIPHGIFENISQGRSYLIENLNFNGTSFGWSELSRIYRYD